MPTKKEDTVPKDVVQLEVAETTDEDSALTALDGEVQKRAEEVAAQKVDVESRRFQSLKDQEVAKERSQVKAEKAQSDRELQAMRGELEFMQSRFAAGLDPEQQQAYAQQLAQHKAMQAQRAQQLSPADMAKQRQASRLSDELTDLGVDLDDSRLDWGTAERFIRTAKGILEESAKAKELEAKEEVPEEKPKEAPPVEGGGARTSGRKSVYTMEDFQSLDINDPDYKEKKEEMKLALREGRIK